MSGTDTAMITPASVTELSDVLRAATAPLRVQGRGSWLHGGGPWATAQALSTTALRGVVEYIPGDLVITVRAGTTLEELAEVTGAHGQMLAMAPYATQDRAAPGIVDATVGAMIATASPAPLPLADMTARDLVLGVQVVTGDGAVTRAGGRVVKNVAGFDLVRLHTGAFGTLGVITEVSLRLHARPPHDTLVRAPLRDSVAEVIPRLVRQRAPLPMLLELSAHDDPVLGARCAGNAARTSALMDRVGEMGLFPQHGQHWSLREEGGAHLDAVRATPRDTVVVRARMPLSDAVPLVRAAREVFPSSTLRFDPATGGLRVLVPVAHASALDHDIATLGRRAAAGGATHPISVVVDQHRAAPRVLTPIEAEIKRGFDARGILNPLAAVPHTTNAPTAY